MKYLFDNNLSPNLAGMLRALDVDVSALREHFPADVTDPELLAALKKSAFDVFVSADRKQTTRPIEASLIRSAKVTALYLGPFWPKLGFWKQAAWLVAKWPMIEGFAEGAAQGTIAEIKQNGRSLIMKLP